MRIKVLHTIPDFHIGGVSNLLLKILAEFGNYDEFEHHICYFLKDETLLENFESLGLTIHKIDRSKKSFFGTLITFHRFLKREKFDIIHSHLLFDKFITAIGKTFTGIPMVNTLHTTNKISENKKFFKRLKLLISDLIGKLFVSKFIAISENVKHTVINYRHVPESKIEMIYSGTTFRGDVITKRKESETLRLITVGRLVKSKNVADIFFCVKELAENINVELIVVGDGPEMPRLKKLATNMKIENRIKFIGFSKNVSQYLQESDIYISASKEEGFSVSVVEALSYALPVITYDLPIFKELSESGEKFLLANNRRQICTHIHSLYDDINYYEQISQIGYNYAKEKFDIKITGKEYLKLYKTLIYE